MKVEILEIGNCDVNGICVVIGNGEYGNYGNHGTFGFSVPYDVHKKQIKKITFSPRRITGKHLIGNQISYLIQQDHRKNPLYYI